MIPSAKPYLGQEEINAIRQVIDSGWVTQGEKVLEFENTFAGYVGAEYACAVSNCTAGLHLALSVLDVNPGDVVITVSHSFIATANCIRYCGAEPVFIDIDLETYNISYQKLKECLQEDCEIRSGKLFYKGFSKRVSGLKANRVSAILVVHQMGMPCDLKNILKLAEQYHLPVVEDCACAVGSELQLDTNKPWEKIGKPHGDIACFSFHPLKIITTGEGGMLTTNKVKYDKKLRLLRHQGMNVSDLKRHQATKVIIERYPIVGYNYRMTDIQAAMGLVQLKKLPAILKRRNQIASFYQKELSKISWLKLLVEPEYCKTNWQSFPVRLLEKSPISRNRLMSYLREKGILTRLGIMNAHQEKPYFRKGFSLLNSENARDNVLILPVFPSMKDFEMKKVVQDMKNV